MRGALSASVCAYLSRPTRALVCAGMQLPALEQRFTHTARIQASSSCTPMFLRARISKMLSVWALVASRPTRPWHPHGHRWSHLQCRGAHERRRVGAGRIREEPSGTALAGSRPWGSLRPPTARAFMRCLRPELVLRSRVRARMTGVHGPACVRDRACVLVTLVRVCGRPVAPSGG